MKMRPKQIVILVLLLIVVLFSVTGCFLSNAKPTAGFTATPTSGVAPLTVSFDASSSFDPDGQIASYRWLLAGGLTQEPKAESGRTISHTYHVAGTFNITLTVTDDKGKTASTSNTIVIRENLSPTASFSATPTTGEAPLTVAFDASTSADPDGSITSYTWNFGDGASGSEVRTSRTYNTPGTFNITLTVTDDKEKTGFATQTIYVSEPAEAPNPDPEPTPPDSGIAVRITASESKIDILSYEIEHGYSRDKLVGRAKNVTSKTLGAVRIHARLLDKDDIQIDTSVDRAFDVLPNTTFEFSLSIWEPERAKTIEIYEITAR